MIDEPAAHDGDGLEAAVRVLREAGHHVAVVHAPAVPALEVLPDGAPGQRRSGAELVVAGRVGIVVVGAEQEGIHHRPLEAERVQGEDGGVHLRKCNVGGAPRDPLDEGSRPQRTRRSG